MYGDKRLAPYACDVGLSKGRFYREDESALRTAFQRDCDRVIHCASFRRLMHKTQVFASNKGDHYRNRLIHTIEVAQIARTLARALGVDENLAETLALAHDFGHPPFGHAGERALDACMVRFGGFNHNSHSFRIVTRLEKRYANFDGLNLTWETLEGIAKHNGPLLISDNLNKNNLKSILHFNSLFDLKLGQHGSIESQVAAIADDIAYNAHDLDDGIRAGLFTIDSISDLPFLGDILRKTCKLYPTANSKRITHEVIRCQISGMVEDVIKNSLLNLKSNDFDSVEKVRSANRKLVDFSREMKKVERKIKDFLFANVYQSSLVMEAAKSSEIIVTDLFKAYFMNPDIMSEQQITKKPGISEEELAVYVTDFIAGMTDTYAVIQHKTLFRNTPELR